MVLFRLMGVETVVFEGMVVVMAVLTRPVPLPVGVVPLSEAPVLLPKGAEGAGVGETIPFDEPFEEIEIPREAVVVSVALDEVKGNVPLVVGVDRGALVMLSVREMLEDAVADGRTTVTFTVPVALSEEYGKMEIAGFEGTLLLAEAVGATEMIPLGATVIFELGVGAADTVALGNGVVNPDPVE